MNIIQAIKALWAVKSTMTEIEKEATTMSGTKPGWQSTEFWMNIAAQVAILWGAVSGFIPPKYAAIISAAGIAIYTVARTIIKAIGDIKAADATQSTITTTQPVTTITTPA